MTWWAIDVRPGPSRRERVGAWLVARTGQAVEERDDGTLVTFAEDERAADALVAALAAAERARRSRPRAARSSRWTGPPAGATGSGARRFGRLTVVPSWVERPAGERPTRRPRSRDAPSAAASTAPPAPR